MTHAPSDAGMDHIPDGGKMAQVARALVALHSPLLASDEYWPKMVRDYLKMRKAHPDYADSRSTITDAFRNARAAIEAMREPTRGMMAAARKEDPMRRKMLGGSPYPEDITGNVDDEFRPLWRAAIDAALRDGEG